MKASFSRAAAGLAPAARAARMAEMLPEADAYAAPAERVEHGPVEPVQAADVDVEEGQRLVGRVKVDDVLTVAR